MTVKEERLVSLIEALEYRDKNIAELKKEMKEEREQREEIIEKIKSLSRDLKSGQQDLFDKKKEGDSEASTLAWIQFLHEGIVIREAMQYANSEAVAIEIKKIAKEFGVNPDVIDHEIVDPPADEENNK